MIARRAPRKRPSFVQAVRDEFEPAFASLGFRLAVSALGLLFVFGIFAEISGAAADVVNFMELIGK